MPALSAEIIPGVCAAGIRESDNWSDGDGDERAGDPGVP